MRSRNWEKANRAKVLAARRRRYAANPEAHRIKQRNWHAANPEKAHIYWRKARGAPLPTRPAPQGCECCKQLPGKRALALDHDHETGAFRGWLCGRCNAGIGLLGDSLDGILAAVQYFQSINS